MFSPNNLQGGGLMSSFLPLAELITMQVTRYKNIV
jgi:hypothetical protein